MSELFFLRVSSAPHGAVEPSLVPTCTVGTNLYISLHCFRRLYADQPERIGNRLPGGKAQRQTRRAQFFVVALDAAGVIEVMELLRKRNSVLVQARRVAADRRLHNLLGQQRDLLDELPLVRISQHGQVDCFQVRHGHAALGAIFDNRADTRVRVLHIVERVVRILLDRKVKVELHLGLCRARVEEEARRIDRDLVEQVC